MSVLIETSLGEVVVDLYTKECPIAAKNFLKLCKIKYYNNVLFFNVQQNFIVQSGDPTGTGKGGTSVYGLVYGEQAKYFEDELRPGQLKHNKAGLLCMASAGKDLNTSQFYITMRGNDMEFLDEKHTVFGEVAEGIDTTLKEINELYCDTDGRPYRDVRIKHTYVLEDPFDDPPGLQDLIPDASPEADRPDQETVKPRLTELEDEEEGLTAEELEERIREVEAKKRAVVLEMIGDIPDAEVKPPENVLFVCKLNPITTDEDLEIILSKFGTCKAEIIRDPTTGDSLNYAFVEFDNVESCEEAYKKMNNVLIDDRRIKVDFSQSVAKIWNKYAMRARGTKIKSRGGPTTAPSSRPPPPGASSQAAPIAKRPAGNDNGSHYSRKSERDSTQDRGNHRRSRSRGRDEDRRRRRSRSRSRDKQRHRDREDDRGRHRSRSRERRIS